MPHRIRLIAATLFAVLALAGAGCPLGSPTGTGRVADTASPSAATPPDAHDDRAGSPDTAKNLNNDGLDGALEDLKAVQ